MIRYYLEQSSNLTNMKPVVGKVRMHNGITSRVAQLLKLKSSVCGLSYIINESILTQWVEYYLSKGK